jgi:transcriptional regulator with XRE-family HTH domain
MEKSIFTREYRVFTQALRAARNRAGLTQIQLAKKLGITQSYLSKVERGERRLDLVQVRTWCQALGMSLAQFVADFESRVGARRKS